MPHQLFILCPNCENEDTIHKDRCGNCQTSLRCTAESVTFGEQIFSYPEYCEWLRAHLPTEKPHDISESQEQIADLHAIAKVQRISKKTVLMQGQQPVIVRGYRGLFRRKILAPTALGTGHLLITPDVLVFVSGNQQWRMPAEAFTSLTTDGHYLEFRLRGSHFFKIEFQQESAYKYEILLRRWLEDFYRRAALGKIIEFQPHIRTAAPRPSDQLWQISAAAQPLREGLVESFLKRTIALLLRAFFSLFIRVQINGREHWTPEGAAFVLVNHQSALDPFIVSAYLDHRIAFLTKTTPFTHSVERRFMQWVRGLPTTRYQKDPSVVNIMKTMLSRGAKVGVFPEAERCWDGQLLPFKYGLVKILMASRMPVYCIQLQNVFAFWPRWSRFSRRTTVQINLLAPFCLLPQGADVDTQKSFLENLFR